MTKEKIGKCHDCTAPQTEVNMLSRHILELQADKGRLIDSVRELEAQIEKMKCCGNCKHRYFIGDELECRLLDNGINCDDEEKWELSEN